MNGCLDDHHVMKLVPNRAERRRKRRDPLPPWTTPPRDRRDIEDGLHKYETATKG